MKTQVEFRSNKFPPHEGEEDEINPGLWGYQDQLLCFIDPSTPVIRKWFKKIDTRQEVTRLAQALEKILASDPDIRDITWNEGDE